LRIKVNFLKNLNVTVTDDADEKLNEIMRSKRFKNRADGVDWIIKEVYKQLQIKKSKAQAIKLGIEGGELR
jgi:hypothetical protein